MLAVAVFMYAFAAAFVLSCLRSNRLAGFDRQLVTYGGWCLMSASFAMTALLLALAAGLVFDI